MANVVYRGKSVTFPEGMSEAEIAEAMPSIADQIDADFANEPVAEAPKKAGLLSTLKDDFVNFVAPKSVVAGMDGKSVKANPEASKSFKRVIEENKQPNTLREGAEIVDGLSGIAQVGFNRGYAGLGRMEAGLLKSVADLTGSDTLANVAEGQNKYADKVENRAVLRGTPVKGFAKESIVQDLPEAGANAISSVINTAPALGLGAVTGGSALPALFGGVALQEYNEGRQGELKPAQAAARALPMALAEVVGEKLGGFDKIATGLRNATKGNGVADLGAAMLESSLKELPAEELTTTLQFLIDKAPVIGLNQDASFEDYKKALKDTALATILQSSGMGAGGATLKALANTLDAPKGTPEEVVINNELAKAFMASKEAESKATENAATAKQAEADTALANITNPDISIDESIALAEKAIDIPKTQISLNSNSDNALLAEVQRATEAIPASDLLEDNNVSDIDTITELATANAGLGSDNTIGSGENTLLLNGSLPQESSDTGSTQELVPSNGTNTLVGNDNRADGALSEVDNQLGNVPKKLPKNVPNLDGLEASPVLESSQVQENFSEELPKVAQELPKNSPEYIANKYAAELAKGREDASLNPSEFHKSFANAIVSKNAKQLEYISNGLNDAGKKVFTEVTGIELPKTQAGTWKAIRDWAGVSDSQDALNKAQLKLNTQKKLLANKVTENDFNTIDGFIRDGFREVKTIGGKNYLVKLDDNTQGINLSQRGSRMNQVVPYIKSLIAYQNALDAVNLTESKNLNSVNSKPNSVSVDVDTDVDNRVVAENATASDNAEKKAKKAKKAGTLLATLRDIGGLALSDKLDVTGERTKFIGGGYNQVFKEASKKTLRGAIESGSLDEFLPYSMRLSAQTAESEAYDSSEAYDYLAEKIRNGTRTLTYEAEEELAQKRYDEQTDTQSTVDLIANELTEDEIDAELQATGNNETEANSLATNLDTENSDGSVASGAGTETAAQGSQANDQENSQETLDALETYKTFIASAKSVAELQSITRDFKDESIFSDKQAKMLDDMAKSAINALSQPAENADLLGDDTAAKQAIADAEREKDAKRNTGTDNQDDFTLSGSDSEFEQARAAGAQELVAQYAEAETQEVSDQKPAPKVKLNRKTGYVLIGNEPIAVLNSDDGKRLSVYGLDKIKEDDRENVKLQLQELAESMGYAYAETPTQDEVTRAKEALESAGITGTDKLNTIAQVRDGKITADEVMEAHGVETITDLGEKIGGARKDNATTGGTRSKRTTNEDDLPTWAKRYQFAQVPEFMVDDAGKWSIYDKRDKDRLGNPRRLGARDKYYDTKEDAIAALPALVVGLKHRVLATAKSEDGTYGYEIYRSINDRKRVKIVDKVFDDRIEALTYMGDNAAEILETNTTFGEMDLPTPDNTNRIGEARRTGDVEGKDFMQAFGLRGVEFGNWNNQIERKQLMNAAYDGLVDLAEVLNIPTQAIGLNGDLALAFGARGQGLSSAKAHYESGKTVINLTKMNGAGSLAHEFFHALDHYFGRLDGKASSEWTVDSDGTRSLKVMGADKDFASFGFGYKSNVRPELQEAYKALIQTISTKSAKYVEDTAQADNFVARTKDDLAQRLDSIRAELSAQKDPKYYKRKNAPATAEQLAEFDTIAKQLLDGQGLEAEYRVVSGAKRVGGSYKAKMTNDALEQIGAIYKAVRGRSGFATGSGSGTLDYLRSNMSRYSQRLKMLAEAQTGEEKTKRVPTSFALNAKELDQGRGTDYWTTPHEMAARAFQGYVEDKIAERGGSSPFLNYGREGAGILTPWGVKFPFPRGEERKEINAALDKFIGELKTKETDTGVALFSNSADAANYSLLKSGMGYTTSKSDIEQAIENDTYGHKFDVYESMADAPDYIQTQALSEGVFGAEGFFDRRTKRVALIARNIKSVDRAVEVARHELIGHYGIENMLGKAEMDSLVERVRIGGKLGNKKIVEISKYVLESQRGLKIKPGDSQAERIAKTKRLGKEIIAVMAERNIQNSIMQRVIDGVRKFLKSIGFIKSDITDAEVAGLLRDAQVYLQGKGRSLSTPSAQLSFSVGQSMLDAAMNKWSSLVDDYQNGKLDRSKIFNIFDTTPASMQVIGMPNLPVKISSHSIDYINDRFTSQQLKKLPVELTDPTLVYVAEDTKTGGISANFVTSIKLNNGKVVVAIKPDLNHPVAGNTNYIATMMVIPDSVIEAKIKQGRTLYAGNLEGEQGFKAALDKAIKEKGTESVNLRKSFLQAFSSQRLNIRIMRKSDAVNMINKQEANFSASNQTDTPAFKRWFGDSKVVDADGKPRIVYHGTRRNFNKFSPNKPIAAFGNPEGIYFTSDKREAEEYAANSNGEVDEKSRVVSAYLKIENDTDGTIKKRNIRGEEVYEYIVFNPANVKSATENNGNFDPDDDRISFSNNPQARLQPSWQVDETSKMDDVIRFLQDKYVDLKRVTQEIKNSGSVISDRWNAYLQEELYHGRTAKRVQDFINQDLKPLIEDMRMRGVGMAEFEEYLWMRHAPERNKQIAKINLDMPDGGAGVTTAEAEAYMDGLDPADKKKYEALAKRIDTINRKSRQALIDYGLESASTIASMESAYEFYVPLMREDMERGTGNGTGTGFKVKGNTTKRAMGSNRAVVDIIANIAQQYEKVIIRGEKNRVATALIGLAKLNPNEEIWEVDTPPTIQHISKATGFVETRTDPTYKNKPNVIVARIVNKRGEIEERSVVFNEFNERAMNLALSMNNLDVDQVSAVTDFMGHVTRYFSSINTQYNPIFGVKNILRDLLGAGLNLTTTKIAGKQKEVLANVMPALRGIYADTRNESGIESPLQFGSFTGAQKTKAKAMAELWEEYQREGGTTGFRDMYANAEERTKSITKALDPNWWTKTIAGKVVTVNGLLTVPETFLNEKAIKPMFEWLSDYNQTLENAVRLAAYKVALDQGLSKQQAASIGKNLTVNFNRKGTVTRAMGSYFAFFNAAVQGTARIGETLTGPKGKQIIAGGIGIGVMQAMMLAAMGFDDEEPPEFLRSTNFIIPAPGTDKGYVTIPMPLGFNVLPNFGRIATEWALSGAENTTDRVFDMFGAAMESFNPLGGNGNIVSMAAPTFLDPAVALALNKDWTNRTIAQEDINGLDPTPGYTRTRDKATAASVELARWINNLSGGDDYEQGNLSPTGDQIEYLVGQVTGGVGREFVKTVTTIESIVTGEDLPTYKIPLVGMFIGNSAGQAPQAGKFYNNVMKLNKIENGFKGRLEDGKDVEEFVADNPQIEFIEYGKNAQSAIRKLKKYKRELVEQEVSSDEVKLVDEEITKIMTDFNNTIKEANEKRP